MTTVNPADYRLPTTVAPRRYELTLTPDLAAATFAGEAAITIDVLQPVQQIVLNAKELAVQQAELQVGDETLRPASTVIDQELERLTLGLPREVAPGTYRLRLQFTGVLNDKLKGFYRSTYRSEQGEPHTIATTQFEATSARYAFPCWDEPAFKAVFSVTLLIDDGLAAISNTAIKSETRDPATQKRRISFNDTMLLSTYLVAFIVGEFESTPPVDVEGTPLGVWCVPGKGHLTPFAAQVGQHALSFFNGYYGIHYPGDKLDVIAIPDFAAGAMENLGASTFRENALLLDERRATLGELQRVADVESHEIAHMWFGDLVTMKWWNGLWLKEAFATFMALLAVDHFKSEWDVWTSFGIGRAGALITDGLHSTRPIEYAVVKPADAGGMYDVLTYEKGAAVLRMLEQYLGAETFRRGINLYLTRHSYANTETSDLWDALEEASGLPVRTTADSWIFQPGYPLISAELRDGALHLSQQRFLYRGRGAGEAEGQLWHVPVAIRTQAAGGAVEQKLLLSGREQRVELPADTHTVVVNAGGSGVYRVRYAPDLLQQLTGEALGSLSAIERFNLVNDAWAAVTAGYLPLAEYLDLTALFRDETDVNVWAILTSSFGSVRRITPIELLPRFQQLVRDRLGPAFQRLGWESRAGESELTRQLRGQLIGALGTQGNDPDVQAQARTVHARFVADPAAADPNVVAACVGIVAFAGGVGEYDEFWQRFKSAGTPQDERRYLFALGSFRDRALAERSLGHALDGSIRTQDAPFLVQVLLSNSDVGDLAWRFAAEHWDEMVKQYPDNTIVRIADGVTALSQPEQAAEIEAFFAAHPVPEAGKRLDQILERLRINVDFRQRETENLRQFLAR